MLFSLMAFAMMIVVSLMYRGELETGTIIKFWAVFLLGGLAIGYLVNAQFALVAFQVLVAVSFLIKARMPRPIE